VVGEGLCFGPDALSTTTAENLDVSTGCRIRGCSQTKPFSDTSLVPSTSQGQQRTFRTLPLCVGT
jgi:hypothetical protein